MIGEKHKKLNDLVAWIGSDAHTYAQISGFLESLDDLSPLITKQFIDSFDMVHKTFKTVVND